MQWSEMILLYPRLIIMESNLLYQHLGTCLRSYRALFNLETKFSLPISANLLIESYKYIFKVF